MSLLICSKKHYSPMNKMVKKKVFVCAICLFFFFLSSISSLFYGSYHVFLNIFLRFLLGFAHVSGRLNETVGALIDCFQDFIPLLHAPQGLNAQSLIDCVQHIFCSIRYAIKLFIRMHTERQASYEEEVILDQDIASRLSKKLLGSFPLNPGNNLSQRV